MLPCFQLIVSFSQMKKGKKSVFYGKRKELFIQQPLFMWGLEKDSISPPLFCYSSHAHARPSVNPFFYCHNIRESAD